MTEEKSVEIRRCDTQRYTGTKLRNREGPVATGGLRQTQDVADFIRMEKVAQVTEPQIEIHIIKNPAQIAFRCEGIDITQDQEQSELTKKGARNTTFQSQRAHSSRQRLRWGTSAERNRRIQVRRCDSVSL